MGACWAFATTGAAATAAAAPRKPRRDTLERARFMGETSAWGCVHL